MLGRLGDLGVGRGAGGIVERSFALLEGCQADSQIQGTWSRALKAARDELCGHMEGQCSRQQGQSTPPVECSGNSKKVWALEQSKPGEGACVMGAERIPLALCGEDTIGRKGNKMWFSWLLPVGVKCPTQDVSIF